MPKELDDKLLKTKMNLLENINKCLDDYDGSNPDVILKLSQAMAIIEGDIISHNEYPDCSD